MGNAIGYVTNNTSADFYVITFNDADWTYSNYYSMYRVGAGTTAQVEAAENSKLKIGVVYYIPTDIEIITGYKTGDYDMWRVDHEKNIEISFIGDHKGAGLPQPGMHDYQGIKRFRFNPTDSKSVGATMSDIAKFEKLNPNAVVNK